MHSLFIWLISISDFFSFLVMKMSHKRKILLFKSHLLVTYQPLVFYTYIFLIHKIHHKISTARNPDKHQPVVCEQDDFWTNRGFSCETVLMLTSPLPHGKQCHGTRLPFVPSSLWSSLQWPTLSHTGGTSQHPDCAWALLTAQLPSLPFHGPAGITTVNNEHGGSMRREKKRKLEQLWDTTLWLWSRLHSLLTQRIQPPQCLLEWTPVPWQFAVLHWVLWQMPAPHGLEARGEHRLPHSKSPVAVCSLESGAQLHSNYFTLHWQWTVQTQKAFVGSTSKLQHCSSGHGRKSAFYCTSSALHHPQEEQDTFHNSLANYCNPKGLVALLFFNFAESKWSVLIITLEVFTACTQSKVLLWMEELHISVRIQQVFKILFLQIKKAT